MVQQYRHSPALGRRIVVYGGSGNGKTHVGKKIVRWANLVATNLPVVSTGHGTQMKTPDAIFCHWPTVVDNFKSGDWDLEDFFNCSLLVIDDPGAEHDPSEVGRSKLYRLLEHRERKWTYISTNFGPDKWKQKFEFRIADRLFRNATHVDMSDCPSYAASV